MKYYVNPNPSSWSEISKRPQNNRDQQVKKVQAILETVQQQGDRALRQYATQFHPEKSGTVGAQLLAHFLAL